jgi:molecular chaperone GrpE
MEMNPVASSGRVSPEIREKILRGLEAWLDEALTGEESPPGLTAELLRALENGGPLPPIEGHRDLYSLWCAMTALTQEVKLQSRTFKQLKDTLEQVREASVPPMHADSSAAGAMKEEREEEEEEEEKEESSGKQPSGRLVRKEQVDLLLDLRDRLERGIRSVREADGGLVAGGSPSIWARCFGVGRAHVRQAQETLAALENGYALTLNRLDQALQDYHLNPILCEGQAFDPHRMTAVELAETDSVLEGTVVGVYRTGYEWEGEVYRSAQVKVAGGARREQTRKEQGI